MYKRETAGRVSQCSRFISLWPVSSVEGTDFLTDTDCTGTHSTDRFSEEVCEDWSLARSGGGAGPSPLLSESLFIASTRPFTHPFPTTC